MVQRSCAVIFAAFVILALFGTLVYPHIPALGILICVLAVGSTALQRYNWRRSRQPQA